MKRKRQKRKQRLKKRKPKNIIKYRAKKDIKMSEI